MYNIISKNTTKSMNIFRNSLNFLENAQKYCFSIDLEGFFIDTSQ